MSILKMKLNGGSRLVRYNPNKGWMTLYDDFDLTSILNGSSLVTLGNGPDKYTEVTLDSSGTITLPDNLSKYNKIRVNIIENLYFSSDAIRINESIGERNIRWSRWHYQYPYYCIIRYSDDIVLVNNGAKYYEDNNYYITAMTNIGGGSYKRLPGQIDFNVTSIEIDKSEGTISYYLNQIKLAYCPLNSFDFLNTNEFKLHISHEVQSMAFSYKIARLQILALK